LSREVVLVFPSRHGIPNPQIPLSLLHVAAPLLHAGYNVKMFDMRVMSRNDFSIGDPVFIGISSMSGLQIRYGLEFAKEMKISHPSCPIVWGGVHPTLLPDQTATNNYVDIVVRGEAESSIVKLADALDAEESLDQVESITYKRDGKIQSNPEGKLVDLDKIPIDLPYDLLPLNRYPSFHAGRFHLQTSRGCPHRCGFCYNSMFNRRKWRGKTASRVIDEIEYVTKKFPNVNCIDFIDDNFFVDRRRVEDICKKKIDHGIDVTWRANCRFDYMSKYDREFITLLEESGCVELNFGAETGSERLLALIDKDVTTEQMAQGVQKLGAWGESIEPYIFWMSGLPTETDYDLKRTFEVMDKLSAINRKTQHIEICIYTPFPSPMLDQFGSEFELPKSLEEWGHIDVFHRRPPWHSKKYVDKLESISATTRYAFYPETRIKEFRIWYRFGYKVINKMAKYRWKHKYFGYPIELRVVSLMVRKMRGY